MRIYENILKTSENRLPQRSYYIPEGVSVYNLLNGEWDFKYYNRDVDVPEIIDDWDKIKVPSCWQTEGFENPNYTNVNYPYPVDPPYVPDENPCGVYRRTFNIDKLWGSVYFVFEGVASCAFLYINNKYVGFTQGNHLQSEFDITPYVCEGKNTVTVKVLKWCVGSYLEDQDFFRMNGIFRDCYILERPIDHITDILLTAKNGKICADLGKEAKVTLYSMSGELLGEQTTDKAEFCVAEPFYWNAEKPYLYTVKIERDGEVINLRTAFRDISISDKYEILLNGVPVKLRGVNHHDTHPTEGWYQSDGHLRRDLELMKELNINCIRTSHYPPTPKFLDMCDEMGFYVILETDIEQHGFQNRDPHLNNCAYDVWNNDWACVKPEWKREHVERMQRTVLRDRNHVSIIMWSTGNESGHGANHEAMIDWVRSLSDGRLIHCEDASRKGDFDHADVFSRMYRSYAQLDEHINDPNIKMPIFLCEYAHAMGNGPGDIWDYNEKFDSHPKLAGGCIWEWADHTVLDKNGIQRYGGDFESEKCNDDNFCCDGVVFSDRSFKAGSLEVKAAYQPMRTALNDGILKITNRLSFTNLNEYDFKYTVEADGKIIKERNIDISVEPLCSSEYYIEQERLSCYYGLYLNCYLYKDGKEVAHTQHPLPFNKIRDEISSDYAKLFDNGKEIVISGKNFKYTVSKLYGSITSMIIDGTEQIVDRFHLTSWLALIDNHRRIRGMWHKFCNTDWKSENLSAHFEKVYSCEVVNGIIEIKGSLSGVARAPYFRYTLKILPYANGKLEFYLEGKVRSSAFWLPRLGFEITIPQNDAEFNYFGNGPYESYNDLCHAGRVSMYSSSANKEYVNYARPQEHGNHTNVKMLKIGKLCFEGEGFDCNVSSYSTDSLTKAEHTDELYSDGKTHLRIDYKVSGIGSNSCGPELEKKYRLDEKDIQFAFTVKPL